MGDFGTAIKYLDWVKSRQASLLEAQRFTVPFDKYYGLQTSRALKKIPYVLNVPKHQISSDESIYQYLPRLVFQYNITLPFSFYIINLKNLSLDSLLPGVITVKWVDINTGKVSRYGLKNGLIGNYKLCDKYTNQHIPSQFSIEYWLGSTFFGHCGINNDFEIVMAPLVNPNFPEELERDIEAPQPYDYPAFSWYLPLCLPQDNSIPTTDVPNFLVDENGNIITDGNGHRIVIRNCNDDFQKVLVDELGRIITDDLGQRIVLTL